MRALLLVALAAFACPGCNSAPPTGPAPASVASAPDAPKSAASLAPPSDAPPIPPGTPTVLGAGTDGQLEAFELAQQALDRGDEDKAIEYFERASDGPITGTSVSAGLAAANLHELRERPNRAQAIYVRLVALAPGVPELRFAAARFFAGQRDTARAIEGFRATIRHQPDFLPAYPLLAALWVQQDKQDDAAQLLLGYETRLNTQLRRLREDATPPGDKRAIIDLLALMNDERATAALVKALKDPTPEVRQSAAAVLGGDDSAEGLKALAEATLAETDPIVRQVMIAALKRARDAARAELGVPAATPSLPAPTSAPADALPSTP